jgi:hypothetical protein
MASFVPLVVHPLVKYSAGPLLGPALLRSAARLRGHECRILDLSARHVQSRLARLVLPRGRAAPRLLDRGAFVGDHDKPRQNVLDPAESVLASIEREFLHGIILPALEGEGEDWDLAVLTKKVQFGFLTHHRLEQFAARLASSPFGTWTRGQLARPPRAPRRLPTSSDCRSCTPGRSCLRRRRRRSPDKSFPALSSSG